MHYRVIKATKITELEELVNKTLALGYEPMGGVSYYVPHGETVGKYVQAVFNPKQEESRSLLEDHRRVPV